ncbi:MAG: phosphatidylcholine/phosphatidylserine synthase [Holosporaceae bacterium]|jgi:CDP-diacylglycerol--serine O-phosphatidyltransferase|nr:phosphatidylcholine/phosphatidylserine synthase [Holosporaceae bacterium]
MKKKDSINQVVENNDGLLIRKSSALAKFLPSTITISAFCFGLTSIRLALFYSWELAVLCIFVAAMLDALDGKIARLLGQSSQFGAELDSLSDLVCFGVAPSVILFLKSVHLLGSAGWGACMFFSICCGLRLARFNAARLSSEPVPEWAKKYFSGVPAPAGAAIAMLPLALFFETGCYMFLNPMFVTCCLLVSGALMISTLKTFSSKMIEIANGFTVVALLSISLLIICLITEIWLTISTLILIYLLSIPYGSYKYSKTKEAEESVKKKA